MAKDKLGESDKPDWSGPKAIKFEKYESPRPRHMIAETSDGNGKE